MKTTRSREWVRFRIFLLVRICLCLRDYWQHWFAVWSPFIRNGWFCCHVIHQSWLIFRGWLLDVKVACSLLALNAVNHQWGGSREHSSCRWWKKRESFQDGGADLPVRWKTIETAHRDRVTPFLVRNSFSALKTDTPRLGLDQGEDYAPWHVGRTTFKVCFIYLNVSG